VRGSGSVPGKGWGTAWDPDGGPLKARGSPSQCPLFRSHAFAVLFPAHRCRCSPFPCISAYGRGWEELGSARGDSELALDRYPATNSHSPPRPGLGADRRLLYFCMRVVCSVWFRSLWLSFARFRLSSGNTLLSTSPEEGTRPQLRIPVHRPGNQHDRTRSSWWLHFRLLHSGGAWCDGLETSIFYT
jgi:hypothetical protein